MKNSNYPNIIFLLIDGLRADHCFGENKKANTPTIDSLIKSGVYFKNSISSTDITGYSMRSIFLGRFPFNCRKSRENIFRKIKLSYNTKKIRISSLCTYG